MTKKKVYTYFNDTEKEESLYGTEHVLRGDKAFWTKNATERFKAGFERLNDNAPVNIDEDDKSFLVTARWCAGNSHDFNEKLVNLALLPDGVHTDIDPPFLSTEQSVYIAHASQAIERAIVCFYRLIVKWGPSGIAWKSFRGQDTLTNTKTELTNCFTIFDEATKVPRIVNERSFMLGVMLYDQLNVIQTGSGIPSEFTTMATNGLPILEARLRFYEAHRSKARINQTIAPLLERNHRAANWEMEKARFQDDSKKEAAHRILNMTEQAWMSQEVPALDEMIATLQAYITYLEEKNAAFAAFNREQQDALQALPVSILMSDYMRVLANPEAREADKIKAWQDLFNVEPSMSPEEIQAPLERQVAEGEHLCQAQRNQIRILQLQLAKLSVCRESKCSSEHTIPAVGLPAEASQPAHARFRQVADEAKNKLDNMPEGNPARIQHLITFITGDTKGTDPAAIAVLQQRLATEENKINAKEIQKTIWLELETKAQIALFEFQTHEKFVALYRSYFQNTSQQPGIFWQYLRDRNERYKHRDWVSHHFFHWLWTPEKEAREVYLHTLETMMQGLCTASDGLPEPDKIAALQQYIEQGIEKFHPRSNTPEQSLLVRLKCFQTALNGITQEINNTQHPTASSYENPSPGC